MKLALLNVRSLLNKSFLINDLICSYNLDFLLLTDTWLDLANNVSTLIESAPPNYNFMSAIRENKKGGGIASIFNASFQCRQSSFGDFVSFEYLSTIIKGSPQIILLIIYRPPKHSPKVCLEELSELLSAICLEYDCVIISGISICMLTTGKQLCQ